MDEKYFAKKIEAKWQKKWAETQAFKAEMETMMKARFERLVADLDLVPREEFDAVKAMAAKARAENDKLSARVAELEKKLGGTRAKDTSAARPPRKTRGNTKRVRRKL